jgi:hypothetical protein
MNFRFLYDPQRRILSIGYRLADAEGPGRLDLSYYDLLASEARLASFIAIAKGDLPETHWFHLGRLVTSVNGRATLLSWSATLFEYLMPMLIMRSYPDTLLDQTCRMVVDRQIEYGSERGVPWGMSESGYNVVDLHDTYQYKAFGVPGLGLKRGLGDELVVAPYATALAAMIDPALAADNLRRLASAGLDGEYGYYESIDYTHDGIDEAERAAKHRGPPAGRGRPRLPGPSPGHDARGSLERPARRPDGQRFHADPRVQATDLLLQERVPRLAPIAQPRPAEETHVAAPSAPTAVRRFRSAHTHYPHAQFLSNGNYVAVVTNGGGGASLCRGRAVTRYRDDPTRDPGSQFMYLRDVRSGLVWSPTFQPVGLESADDVVTFLAEKATFHRSVDDIGSQLDIAVSTDDDVEVRRLALSNHSEQAREFDVTSYAEIVLAPLADDLAHAAFGKLFVETEYLPESSALLCRRRPRGGHEAEVWAVHVLSLEGRTQGPLEWETDRARFLGRGRGPDNPQALDGRSLSGTTGAVLDPIVALRQRIRLAPGGFVRLSFATGMASSRETAVALAHKYREPSATARTFALAYAHAQSRLRHLGISSEEALLFERLASRVLYADRSLRASPDVLGPQRVSGPGGPLAACDLRRPADPPRAGRRRERPPARAPGAPGAGVLAAQGPQRRRRHPQRAPGRLLRRDARADHGAARHRPVEGLEAPSGRSLPAARRPRARSRAHPPRDRGARRAERRPWRTGQPARSALCGVAGTGTRRVRAVRIRAASGGPAHFSRARGHAGARAGQRSGRVRRRGPGVCRGARGGAGNTPAMGQRHRQPLVRNGRHDLGRGLHVVGEQPREPADALRKRSRHGLDGGSPVRPRRRDRGGVGTNAGSGRPPERQRPCRDPPRCRAHALRTHGTRHPPRPRRLRGQGRPGEVLVAQPHERERVESSSQPVRVQRVGPGAPEGRPGGACRH